MTGCRKDDFALSRILKYIIVFFTSISHNSSIFHSFFLLSVPERNLENLRLDLPYISIFSRLNLLELGFEARGCLEKLDKLEQRRKGREIKPFWCFSTGETLRSASIRGNLHFLWYFTDRFGLFCEIHACEAMFLKFSFLR